MKRNMHKVAFIGGEAVGKSSVAYQMKNATALKQSESTIGAAYLKMDLGKHSLEMWDTSGQERFGSLVPMYVRGAHVIICVYDITNPATLERVERDILRYSVELPDTENATWIVVGNKVDLIDRRQIPMETGSALASRFEFSFVEVSARTRKGIPELLDIIESKLDTTLSNDSEDHCTVEISLMDDESRPTRLPCCNQ